MVVRVGQSRFALRRTEANAAAQLGHLHSLQLLQANAPDLAATYIYVPADPAGTHGRTAAALAFAQQHGFPVVLKPDVGLRGRGVYVARSEQQVSDYLSRFGGDLIVQRHIAGLRCWP